MKITRRGGSFIKQFVGPGDNGIICFRFWQAVIASGCPGECSYCFLQNQYPYRSGLYDVKGTLFENLKDLVPETKIWLARAGKLALIVGENQDGLAFESSYKKLLGVTPLELLVPLFETANPSRHLLIVLSKFTSTQFLEKFDPPKNVVLSWSLSLPSISEKYERKVASLEARLQKAKELKKAGYRIRFRLDALAPIPKWRSELRSIVAKINDIGPEMLTLGALRSSHRSSLRRASAANGRDDSIFDHIADLDPSGFKFRTDHDFHVQAFRRVQEQLNPAIALGLCKEDVSLWNEVGVKWRGCHCLQGVDDRVAEKQSALLAQTLKTTQL